MIDVISDQTSHNHNHKIIGSSNNKNDDMTTKNKDGKGALTSILRQSKYNKSIDFDRHNATTTTSSSSKPTTTSSSSTPNNNNNNIVTASPRRTIRSGSKRSNKSSHHETGTNASSSDFDNSYATFGESVMGESFGNLSMSVLSLDHLDLSDNDGDDDNDESNSNSHTEESDANNPLEEMIAKQMLQKSKLEAILDFEDDKE